MDGGVGEAEVEECEPFGVDEFGLVGDGRQEGLGKVRRE